MNGQEFVDKLRAALNGRISPEQVEDNVSYYRDYIAVEVRKGRTEGEVLASLGDPRLIARTIIQTSGQGQEPDVGREEPERNVGYDGYDEKAWRRYRGIRRLLRLPGWLVTVIVVLIVISVFSLVFSVLSFLAPFLLVFAAVAFMVKLFRDWLK